VPTTDAATLRSAGRAPTLPAELALDDGRWLVIAASLRVLPGKRLTGVGSIDGQMVLAKLFFAQPGARRHWERELRGLEALRREDIPSPRLLASGFFSGDGCYLLTEYLAPARAPAPLSAAELQSVLRTLGRMHAHGLVHEDAHLDNFLITAGEARVIDGDAIRTGAGPREIRANLALLLAQLPPETEAGMRSQLLASYREEYDAPALDLSALGAAIRAARQRRLDDYLGKCLRDCSLFKVERCWDRFVATSRDETEFLAPLVANPDRWIESGRPLKLGRTATLAQVELDGRQLVVKRYNIKNLRHALARGWRPSRAWHSWCEAHRMRFLGIPTPRPLALIERRFGPLRGRAWLVTEYCPGPSLAETPLDEDGIRAVVELFRRMAAARVTHGDLKATNLLWNEGNLVLIDLDAARQHARVAGFRRAWRKDRARFLRNWPEGSMPRAALDAALPAA
jgi:tRNA A-37 threonylcarbamoyl transferase component Bud32